MQDKIQYALSLLDRVQFAVRDLDNSREKSIVITHLETAELWLERLQKYEEAKIV